MIFRYLIEAPIKPFAFIKNFFKFWYIEGSNSFWEKSFFILKDFESEVAVIPTFYNLFSPLYQDYSIMGRFIGPVFRIFRIIFGLALYVILIALISVCYLIWMALPPLVLIMILLNVFG